MSSKEKHMLQMQKRRTLWWCMQIWEQKCQSPWVTITASSSTVPELPFWRVHSSIFQCWCPHTQDCNCQSLNSPTPELRIRPLWLSKELPSQIYFMDCKVNTWQAATSYHSIKWRHFLEKLTGYNNSLIKKFGSIIVFLYHGNEKYKFSVK